MEQLFDDLEDFGSFDDAISGDVRDPYTELARLRREEAGERLGAAVSAACGPVLGEGVMLGMGEPTHGRLRSLVSKAFTQKSLARWQDELVGRVANGLIDNFAPNGKADLVKEFTFDYPSQIIAGLFGRGVRILRPDPRGSPCRSEGRSDQRARCRRDRRTEARGRRDLLVPS